MFERLQHPGRLVFKQVPVGQGLHPDPLDPAVSPPSTVSCPAWRAALTSDELQRFRDALRLPPDSDVRAGVLDDLSSYFGISSDECVERCIHWEESSVTEWFERTRQTPGGLLDFYRSTQSWAFDLLWFAYLQVEGYGFPASVIAARDLRHRHVVPGTHLDFGSGVGVTSQLFAALGYETHLGDVSTSLLEFARFRLDRRGQAATYLDLAARELEAERYDVVTAIDTLAHVPDLAGTACRLHTALRPGGWLFANVDVRAPETRQRLASAGRRHAPTLSCSGWASDAAASSTACPCTNAGRRRSGRTSPGPNREPRALEPSVRGGPASALAHLREAPTPAAARRSCAGSEPMSDLPSPAAPSIKRSARAMGLTRERLSRARWRLDRGAHATRPRRSLHRDRILCYHAVGTPAWGLNDIAPQVFRRQLQRALDEGHTSRPPRTWRAPPTMGGGSR